MPDRRIVLLLIVALLQFPLPLDAQERSAPQWRPAITKKPSSRRQSTSVHNESGHPIDPALKLVELASAKLRTVQDYSARIVSQERIGAELSPPIQLEAKFRRQPSSFYLKWVAPKPGQEAIFVEGENGNKILFHTVGITRAFKGIEQIDPDSTKALKNRRHSLREMGLDSLLAKLKSRFEFERRFQRTIVTITPVKVNERTCQMVSTVHPEADDGTFMFHTLRVYFDLETKLPIQVEAFGFPEKVSMEPGPLLESYSWLELKLNCGFTGRDFSVDNPDYSFHLF